MKYKKISKPSRGHTYKLNVSDKGHVIVVDIENDTNEVVSFIDIDLSKEEAKEIASLLNTYAEVN